jgi:hypothetical protein
LRNRRHDRFWYRALRIKHSSCDDRRSRTDYSPNFGDVIKMKSLKAGTGLTCENGHKVCELVWDIVIYPGVPADVRWFGNPAEGVVLPKAGDRTADFTCRCGAKWMRLAPSQVSRMGIQIHTDNGWWP